MTERLKKESYSPKERRCLGRNQNLRRCVRHIKGRWFCQDHKWQPLILLFVIVISVWPGVITIKSYYWPGLKANSSTIVEKAAFTNRPSPALSNVDESKNIAFKNDSDGYTIKYSDAVLGEVKTVKPEKSKVYNIKFSNRNRLNYMLEDEKLFIEHSYPSGGDKIAYYVIDAKGKIVDSKFPYQLNEYTVIIPPEIEVRRSERILSNGWKAVNVELKWNDKVDMIFDPDNKLQSINIDGGVAIDHKSKTFVVGRKDAIKK